MHFTFREVEEFLAAHGFVQTRHGATSHSVWQGTVDGKVQLVTVAKGHPNGDVAIGTLSSVMRQSGISKKVWREWKRQPKKRR